MADDSIIQPTLFGDDIVLRIATGPRRSATVRPNVGSAPLFDARDPLAGISPRLRKEFTAAAKRHAKDHPKAKPLTILAYLRAASRPTPRRPPGRPTSRPPHVTPARWDAYIHARASATRNDSSAEFPDFDTWVLQTSSRREWALRGLRSDRRSMRQEVRWVVVVPRSEMIKNPSIEVEWHRRLMFDPSLAKTHRMHLRGVQRRVA